MGGRLAPESVAGINRDGWPASSGITGRNRAEYALSKINQQREERYKMSPQKLGRITRSLGFNKYNSGDARGIYIDADLLNRLCQRYGIKQSDGILTI